MKNADTNNNSAMLIKMMRILDCFTLYEPLLSSKELGDRIGLNNSSLFRYISMLCDINLLEKDPATGKYLLGMKSVEMGGIRLSSIDALRLGFVNMDELCSEAKCNVNMAVLYRGDAFHIHYVLATEDNSRAHAVIGRRTPAHMTALGKAIYAHMPREKVREIIAAYGWREKMTPATIDNFEALDADLDATVERGYAIDDGESNVDQYCIAAPIFRQNREVVAAISISAPKEILKKKEPQLRKSLIMHALNISYKMGYYE